MSAKDWKERLKRLIIQNASGLTSVDSFICVEAIEIKVIQPYTHPNN